MFILSTDTSSMLRTLMVVAPVLVVPRVRASVGEHVV